MLASTRFTVGGDKRRVIPEQEYPGFNRVLRAFLFILTRFRLLSGSHLSDSFSQTPPKTRG